MLTWRARQAYAADLAYLKQKVDAGGCVFILLSRSLNLRR